MAELEPKFQSGQVVKILTGDFSGRTAQIGQSASVEGKFQYGLTGLSETEGNLYAVHEHEITETETVIPTIEEVPDPAPAPTNNIQPVATGEPEDVSSLLQRASQIAQERKLESNQALQNILARLDRIDQHLETKEIKVIVEVQHTHDYTPVEKSGGHPVIWGGKTWMENGPVPSRQFKDGNDAQLNIDLFAEGEEE